MINLDQLKQEVSDITHEFDRKVAMQVIDYLIDKGYLIDEWRPIETAPRDGTKILGFNKEYGGARETSMSFYQEGSLGYQYFVSGTGPREIGWEWREPIHGWCGSWMPTHWMSLQEPPKEKENDQH